MEFLMYSYVLISVVGIIVFATLKVSWMNKTSWHQRKVLLGHRTVDVTFDFVMIVFLTMLGSPALTWQGRDVFIYG